jgi:soluble lytic murein transglycosylase-like protein
MSVEAVVARVSELQAMIARAHGAGPAGQSAAPAASGAAANAGTSFQQQLSQAQSLQAAGAPGAAGPGAATPFAAEIDAAAARHGVDPALLRGLIRAESNFNPKAGSHAGAQGLTQLMPGTARGLGVTDPFDPVQSINGGAKYLRQQLDRFGGDVTKALAAYNAGPGAVQRYGGVPPYAETQNYVKRVQAYAAEYSRAGSSAPVPANPAPVPVSTVAPGSGALPYSTT